MERMDVRQNIMKQRFLSLPLENYSEKIECAGIFREETGHEPSNAIMTVEKGKDYHSFY